MIFIRNKYRKTIVVGLFCVLLALIGFISVSGANLYDSYIYIPIIWKYEYITATPTPPTITPTPTPTQHDPEHWLSHLNDIRFLADLSPLTEDFSWSEGCWKHARYMVKNDVIQHYEEQGNFWFSEEGDIAAQNSNLMASWNIMRSDRSAIDLWMSGPFHGIGLIDPAMSMTGFGSYRETDPFGNISMSACLDILQGLDELSPDTKFPIMWPGEGRLMPYTSYTGSEWPDPLASCPGYNKPSGAPIYLQIGAGDMIPMVSDHTLSLDGVPLEHCLFDETTYSNPSDIDAQNVGRAILGARDAIIVIPRDPLTPGLSYSISVTSNGITYAWSFTVSDNALTTTSINSNDHMR